MQTMIMADGYQDPARGGGGGWGLLAGAFVCYLVWLWDKRRQARKAADGKPTPPPAPALPAPRGVEPSSAKPREAHWAGRIENVGGALRRVYDSAAHVARTGNSPAPPAPRGRPVEAYEPPEPDTDPELDLPLTEADHGGAAESREEYAARCVAAGVATSEIVSALEEYYGVSRATAYRVVERVPGRRAA